MKRYDAIKAVSDAILQDGLAEALFLKGSIARGEDGDYSDVDLYVVVTEDNFVAFLTRRIEYLEQYRPLVNWVEVNFVGPQIVGIFDDALHFDLYAVKPDAIPQTGAMKVLHDPDGMLADYQNKPLSLTNEELTRWINNFTYLLTEIEATYMRGDLLRCCTLFSDEYDVVSLLIRHIYDPQNSLLGNKGLYKVISIKIHEELLVILELATPSNVIVATKKLLKLFEKTLLQLPIEVQSAVNREFYELLSNRIYELEI